MLVNGHGQSPAGLPAGKTQDSYYSKGLVGPILILFFLIDC